MSWKDAYEQADKARRFAFARLRGWERNGELTLLHFRCPVCDEMWQVPVRPDNSFKDWSQAFLEVAPELGWAEGIPVRVNIPPADALRPHAEALARLTDLAPEEILGRLVKLYEAGQLRFRFREEADGHLEAHARVRILTEDGWQPFVLPPLAW